MSETLTFDKTHYYNTLKPGITLTAILHYGQASVECEARLDTGSSRDRMKNMLCARFELPLLRVNRKYLPRVGTDFQLGRHQA